MNPRKGKKIEVETPSSAAPAAEGAVADAPEVLEPEVLEPEVEAGTPEPADAAQAASGEIPAAAPADGQAPAEDAAEAPSAQAMAAALAEAATAKDRYVRLQAEWDNYRKRTAAERVSERERAAERIVTDLLPVIDDFERALAHVSGTEDEAVKSLADGVEAVHTKLLAVLAKEKVQPIDPAGEAFDANRHQAVGNVADETVPEETVMQVYQKGYEMAGHVIRPAMVTVSTGGPRREEPAQR